ncbi:PDDEXK nuclease domain-containing protein, partial [Adlercreutzia equolifaciens]|uniref:PDDEXK nuclease domain-containing protein n=1 Tax=Adlercreutzia equolifaciens TaxID=446660 RepID=UPI0019D4762C
AAPPGPRGADGAPRVARGRPGLGHGLLGCGSLCPHQLYAVRGFCFVARQKLMRYDDEDFYVDLVFYHSVLKCYVLIDLKVGKLTHGDVGQMDSYIRMFDDLMRRPDDNPTIGLILCSEKNEAIAKYSTLADGRQMFASRYQFELPSVEELESCIMEKRRGLEDIVGVVSDVGPRESLAASTRHPTAAPPTSS